MTLKTLTPHIAKNYIKVDFTAEDISEILPLLTPTQLYRITQYEKAMGDNLNSKRLFLYICNLIDFDLIKKNKT